VRKNPSLTTTGSYYAGPLKTNAVRIAPVVNSFTLNKYAGKNTELFFNFSITANGGKNIFWSILREGSKTPLFSGNSLQTVNGVSTVGNVSTMLNHFITEQDFLTKKVRIFFLLVVVYDLTEDGSRLDEKILNTAVYKVSNQQAVTGFCCTFQRRLVPVHTN
jgi:hypothetical protein